MSSPPPDVQGAQPFGRHHQHPDAQPRGREHLPAGQEDSHSGAPEYRLHRVPASCAG